MTDFGTFTFLSRQEDDTLNLNEIQASQILVNNFEDSDGT